MNMEQLRADIDRIDKELLDIFTQRMDVVNQIGQYKKEQGLPVLDAKREKEKLQALHGKVREDVLPYSQSLFDILFELSRNYQNSQQDAHTELYGEISDALEHTAKLFPERATVACQGIEGAYSGKACERLFKQPNTMYFQNFGAVFSAIESGLCDYGVLPLENSIAGSVNQIYDLMMGHKFKIVKSVRLKIDHCLLVPKGVKLGDVKEVFSHEQAISQCASFLGKLGSGVKITRVANTAMAAEMVSQSGRCDVAAISSHSCAKTYHLDVLGEDIQDRSNNYTRFICISRNLEIYPGADRTSIMMVLPHSPGALYKALARFYSLGINLNKLESRPIPERDFAFMFYFDLETSVYSQAFVTLMDSLNELCEEFEYLGSYIEVI